MLYQCTVPLPQSTAISCECPFSSTSDIYSDTCTRLAVQHADMLIRDMWCQLHTCAKETNMRHAFVCDIAWSLGAAYHLKTIKTAAEKPRIRIQTNCEKVCGFGCKLGIRNDTINIHLKIMIIIIIEENSKSREQMHKMLYKVWGLPKHRKSTLILPKHRISDTYNI